MENICNISFTARPGAGIVRRAVLEYNGDEVRLTKFKKLFHDTFENNLDENTVINLDEQERYVFSNLKFPNIFYKSDEKLDRERGRDFLSAVIMACPKVLSSLEHKMIRTIIKECYKSGISPKEMSKMAEENIQNAGLKKYFLDNLNIARRIKENNPNSKLTLDEFEEMEMQIFDELAEIPGTLEYKMVHGDITLDIG